MILLAFARSVHIDDQCSGVLSLMLPTMSMLTLMPDQDIVNPPSTRRGSPLLRSTVPSRMPI